MLKAKGHLFVSDTDTEVIVHLVEEYAKTTMFSKAVQRAFKELDGLNAIILINTTSHEMIAARNGSPLVVGFGVNENFLASDPAALLPHTKQVHFLDDDEMAIVKDDSIHIYNATTGDDVRPRKQMLTWTAKEAEKGHYPFFMLKEIHEQAGLLSEIASESAGQSIVIAKELKKLLGYIWWGWHVKSCGAHSIIPFSLIAKKLINFGVASEFDHRVSIIPEKVYS